MPKVIKTIVEATCDKCGEEVIVNEDAPGFKAFVENTNYIFHYSCITSMGVLEYSELVGMPLITINKNGRIR